MDATNAIAPAQRTDVHAPSAIIPHDYEYVAQECRKIDSFSDCAVVLAERARIQAHMKRTGGTYSGHEHGGNCMVCGSVNAIYTVLFYHAKTNSYVRMGQDCAQKCEMGNERAFKAFKAGIDDARDLKAGKTKAKAILSELGLDAAWPVYEASVAGWEENTIRDIVGKLVRYGSASEKQFDFVRTLLGKIAARPDIEAKRAAERAVAKPCPSGRLDIEGEIIGLRVVESDFGDVEKMTVKTVDGYLVYGTRPASLFGAKRGDRIRFSATLTPSDRDEKFGFFGRPTNGEMI